MTCPRTGALHFFSLYHPFLLLHNTLQDFEQMHEPTTRADKEIIVYLLKRANRKKLSTVDAACLIFYSGDARSSAATRTLIIYFSDSRRTLSKMHRLLLFDSHHVRSARKLQTQRRTLLSSRRLVCHPSVYRATRDNVLSALRRPPS